MEFDHDHAPRGLINSSVIDRVALGIFDFFAIFCCLSIISAQTPTFTSVIAGDHSSLRKQAPGAGYCPSLAKSESHCQLPGEFDPVQVALIEVKPWYWRSENSEK